MSKNWFISGVFAFASFFFAFLFSVYPKEIRQIISSIVSVSDATFAYYIFFCISLFLLVASIAYIGYLIYKKFKFDVILQDNSLRFNKYPCLWGHHGRLNPMTNMSYSEVSSIYPRFRARLLRRSNCFIKLFIFCSREGFNNYVQ